MSFTPENVQSKEPRAPESPVAFVQSDLHGAQGASFFFACLSAVLLAHSAEVNSAPIRGLGLSAFAFAIVIALSARKHAIRALTKRLARSGISLEIAEKTARAEVSRAFALSKSQRPRGLVASPAVPPAPNNHSLVPADPRVTTPIYGIEQAEGQSGLHTILSAERRAAPSSIST